MFDRIMNLMQIRQYWMMDLFSSLTSKMQKKIIRAFRSLGLKIEISSNLKIINFLDKIFSFEDNTFKPFSKKNHVPTNINVNSKHPKSIIKLYTVNLRINRLSSGKEVFDENKRTYNEALNNSRFQHK